ncbi:hypothetical protein Tco_0652144 [Tanacetum coccineum]|uniref:Uncharacterized protein n=1 Tax=Tanacetum coccineum TaxID=301880 RepID=A0ABQ4WWZ4_9ASTR
METCGSGDITKKGFWSDVFANFEKDMGGTIREYDAIVSKWKNSIRPKVVAFSVVYDGVQKTMDAENGVVFLPRSGVDLEVEALKAKIARWAYNSSYISVYFTRSYTIRTPSSAANVNVPTSLSLEKSIPRTKLTCAADSVVGSGDVGSFKDEILKLQKGRAAYKVPYPADTSSVNEGKSGILLTIIKVWKKVDTAYWVFLRVGTTFDIFQNILFPYGLNTAYWSFLDTTYLILFPSWSLVKCRHRYAVSSLMDTAYWLSKQ